MPAELVTEPLISELLGSRRRQRGAAQASARTSNGSLGADETPCTVLLATTRTVYVVPGCTPLMTHGVPPS